MEVSGGYFNWSCNFQQWDGSLLFGPCWICVHSKTLLLFLGEEIFNLANNYFRSHKYDFYFSPKKWTQVQLIFESVAKILNSPHSQNMFLFWWLNYFKIQSVMNIVQPRSAFIYKDLPLHNFSLLYPSPLGFCFLRKRLR